MPSLTFILPHWLYWSGLVLFPLLAMFIVRRQSRRKAGNGISLPTGYLLWLCGGYVGLHRFYVMSAWGGAYIPLFLAILFGNLRGRAARDRVSGAQNDLMGAEFDVERFQNAVDQATEGATEKLAKAEQVLAATREQLAAATANFDQWQLISGGLAVAICVLLLVDAFLLPRLVRRCAEREPATLRKGTAAVPAVRGTQEVPTGRVHSKVTDVIDAVSGWSGEFVCYWSVIAVFVYFYEVIARYVFNSPTNWAHESMFLMFGMQYLLSGAYALREDAHVRVDVIYLLLPDRGKVITDIVTSVFFFIFGGTLLATGWTFMWDSINVMEVSFTEWAIQYWPVKITIALGALLLLLQGVSKLIKDILLLRRKTG
ncbi:MAG: TRAP transporter small permease subunit [Alphaproteobacteria bacterium]